MQRAEILIDRGSRGPTSPIDLRELICSNSRSPTFHAVRRLKNQHAHRCREKKTNFTIITIKRKKNCKGRIINCECIFRGYNSDVYYRRLVNKRNLRVKRKTKKKITQKISTTLTSNMIIVTP